MKMCGAAEFNYAIWEDDKDRFIELLKGSDSISGLFVSEMCRTGALQCITALLQGETQISPNYMLHIINSPYNGIYPLHQAAGSYKLSIVKLLLQHGASTHVITCSDRIRMSGLLPLRVALENLRYHEYLLNLYLERYCVFALITRLCMPQMRVALEVIRVLAESTKNTLEIFEQYVREGQFIEIAVLLMVARGSVEGMMSIHQWIQDKIFSLVTEEGYYLKGFYPEFKSIRACMENRKLLCYSLCIFEVFERAGDSIDEYLQCDHTEDSKENVVEDVASILKKAGFVPKREEEFLSLICWKLYERKSSNMASNELALGKGNYLAKSSKSVFAHPKKPIIDIGEEKWMTSTLFPSNYSVLSDKSICCLTIGLIDFTFRDEIPEERYKRIGQPQPFRQPILHYSLLALNAIKKVIR